MKKFTGWQYLLIDLANQFGHDKLVFEERIQWAEDNLSNLEALVEQAETKPLYNKAMQAIRKAQTGIPSGHMVGLDACCMRVDSMRQTVKLHWVPCLLAPWPLLEAS